MAENISNSRAAKIFIEFFKLSSLIIFKYPHKKFEISKIGIVLFSLNVIFCFWSYYGRFLEYKEQNLASSKILDSVILLYALLDPTLKVLSLLILLFSQKSIFKMLKNIEELNNKILEINSIILDNNIWFLIIFSIDVLLTFCEYGEAFVASMAEISFYIPMHFSTFIMLLIIKRLQSLENILK
jgi:hypothetical protein